jgi:hypothetical protein
MALVVITVIDGPEGADVGILSEPAIPTEPSGVLSPAQVVALDMLRAAVGDHPIKKDKGLIKLIN